MNENIMKSAIIIFLAVLVVVLGFSVSSLQKELLSVSKNAAFYEKRSDDLQGELMRVNQAFLGEKTGKTGDSDRFSYKKTVAVPNGT
ncbi:hypothetical protein KKD87_03715 [bacterium]|nr:hypothetical protein [bacterium]